MTEQQGEQIIKLLREIEHKLPMRQASDWGQRRPADDLSSFLDLCALSAARRAWDAITGAAMKKTQAIAAIQVEIRCAIEHAMTRQ